MSERASVDDAELIARWLADDLPPEEAARVAARVAVEPELQRLRDSLLALDAAAKDLPRASLDERRVDALVERALPPRARPARTWAAVAAAAVVLLAFAWWRSPSEPVVTATRDTVVVNGKTLVAGESVSGAGRVELSDSGAAELRMPSGLAWLGNGTGASFDAQTLQLERGAVVADGPGLVLLAGGHRFVVQGQALLSMEPLSSDFRGTASKATPEELLMQRKHFVIGAAALATFAGTLFVTRGTVHVDSPLGGTVVNAGEQWTPNTPSPTAVTNAPAGLDAGSRTPTAPSSLEVTVLADGQPLRNAKVMVSRERGLDPSTALPRWVELEAAETDDAGRARLAASAGTYFATAAAPGWAHTSQLFTVAEGAASTRVVLSLERGVVLEGKTAEARTGAVVTPATLTFTPWRGPAREAVTVDVDARGQFKTPPLAGGEWLLDGVAPGAGRANRRLTLPTEGPFTVLFHASGFVEGFVQFPDGGPAAGATVLVVGDDVVTTESSASGAFSAEVTSGAWAVQAVLGPLVGHADTPLDVAGGKTARAGVLVLGEGSRLSGQVLLGNSGVRATVVVSPHQSAGEVARIDTDEQGRYAVPLAPGVYDVVAEASGRGTAEEFGINLQGPTRVDLSLGRNGTIDGEVVDEGGRAVSSMVVEVKRGNERRRTTSRDGRFSFTDLRPGVWTVRALDENGRARAHAVATVEAAQTSTHRLEIATPSVIEGRVTSKCAGAARATSVLAFDRWGSQRAPVVGGRYHLDVVPGSYWLLAQSEDETCRSAPMKQQRTVGPGERVEVDLTLLSASKTLELQVVDASGEPVKDVMVTWVDPAKPNEMTGIITFTDERGLCHFAPRFGESVPAQVQAVATRSGRSGKTGALQLGQPRATLTLQPSSSLELTLVGLPEGARARVELVSMPSFSFQDVVAVSTTRSKLEGLPSGRVHASVTVGSLVGGGEAVLSPDAPAALTVELQAGATVTGRMVVSDGGVRAGWVGLDAPTGEEVREPIAVDSSGRFALGPAPAGKWVLVVRGDGAGVIKRPVTLEAGVTLDVGDVVVSENAAP